VSFALLWIPATIAASLLQTARNLTQRSLTQIIGVVGATQVRFLFGLPFAVLFLVIVCAVAGRLPPEISTGALAYTIGGALTQIAATALMLAAMRERSFAVTTAYTKTEPVQVAIFGALLLGDALTPAKFAAIMIATVGVVLVSWKPGEKLTRAGLRPALLGVGAGAFFAFFLVGVLRFGCASSSSSFSLTSSFGRRLARRVGRVLVALGLTLGVGSSSVPSCTMSGHGSSSVPIYKAGAS